MKNLIFAILMLMVVSVAFAQEKTATETFKTVKSIKLTTASGNIIIKKSNDGNTKVTVRYTYDDQDYKPLISNSEGMVTLEEKFNNNSGSGTSNWAIEMPDNVRLRMTSGSGDLSIAQLKADMKFTCGSGDIELSAVSGDLDFNTGSGNVEFDNIGGEVNLNTGSGDITLKNSKGEFSFNAGSGNIRFEKVEGSFDANTGSGDIKATNVTVSGASSFNTGSGNATVSLGADLKSNISINSGSGNSKLEFNGTPINGEVIMTANERSGDIVAPFKFNKEETIDNGGSQKQIRKTANVGNQGITIKVGTGSGTAEIAK